MNVEASARQEMEIALREAVQQQVFELFYQPRIGLPDGEHKPTSSLLRIGKLDLITTL
jgi:EAL domain-containing protein (putative c-di-GMP-specific phosphodiesterase class I)